MDDARSVTQDPTQDPSSARPTEWLWPADAQARVKRALVALVGMMFAVLAYQVFRRIVFPWDLYIWSESPFMTNMMKLATASSVFDGPSEASSWVYSPGLEYVCFALLRPVGLHLDVRACRAVNVIIGLGGSYFAAKCSSMLLGLLDGARPAALAPPPGFSAASRSV